MIPLTLSDRIESLHNQGYTIIEYNPLGNCQFSALCFLLQRVGVHRSPQSLREEIVRYLRENPNPITVVRCTSMGWSKMAHTEIT